MTFFNKSNNSILGSGSSSLLLGSSLGGLLLLGNLGEELLVVLESDLVGLVAVLLVSLVELLSAESGLSDESLDLGSLVVGLVTSGHRSVNNVLSHIVDLAETEHLSDVVGSLGTESVGSLVVGETLDISITLLDDSQGNDGEVGSVDGTSDGLSLALAGSSLPVAGATYTLMRLIILLII